MVFRDAREMSGDCQAVEVCDVCGSNDVQAFKCKLICQNCGTIIRTCSDLVGEHCGLRTNSIADC
jgi:hypothetical protein